MISAAPIATANRVPSECQPDVPGISDRRTGELIADIVDF